MVNFINLTERVIQDTIPKLTIRLLIVKRLVTKPVKTSVNLLIFVMEQMLIPSIVNTNVLHAFVQKEVQQLMVNKIEIKKLNCFGNGKYIVIFINYLCNKNNGFPENRYEKINSNRFDR